MVLADCCCCVTLSGRQVYMDIGIGGQMAGRIVFEMFADQVSEPQPVAAAASGESCWGARGRCQKRVPTSRRSARASWAGLAAVPIWPLREAG